MGVPVIPESEGASFPQGKQLVLAGQATARVPPVGVGHKPPRGLACR